ncbi:MAG: uroporphyrinogen decarboxylase family protein [Candidatus Omnitrophota bacterium]|nr:uroporphyrinogen decarboxylase family protein [Candidatus Omnitrophota bacterium]
MQYIYHEKRERLLNAIEFKPVDRLPVNAGNGTIAALERITGRQDYLSCPKEVYAQAMKRWDVDLVQQFVLPDRQDRSCGPGAEVNIRNGLLSVVYGMLEDWVKKNGPIKSPENFRDFCRTIPSRSQAVKFVDSEITACRWLELNNWGEFLKPIVWMPGHLCGTVGWMWYTSVGYENYLMAHLLYPEEVERLFAFTGEEGRLRNISLARTIKKCGLIPCVYSGEDICINTGPLCSPKVLRKIYFPHLKRAVEPLRDAGIHWMWHSDGNILPILPDLLDCGIDGFQGFEEDKGMDLMKLAETKCKNGRLPFLCGSVNVTTTMYTTPEKIKVEIIRMVSLAKTRGGGVILAPSSSMMENMPVENVLAFYEYAALPSINRF